MFLVRQKEKRMDQQSILWHFLDQCPITKQPGVNLGDAGINSSLCSLPGFLLLWVWDMLLEGFMRSGLTILS